MGKVTAGERAKKGDNNFAANRLKASKTEAKSEIKPLKIEENTREREKKSIRRQLFSRSVRKYFLPAHLLLSPLYTVIYLFLHHRVGPLQGGCWGTPAREAV